MLFPLVGDRRFLSFPVASSAQIGDVSRKGGGGEIVVVLHIMHAMAVGAVRGDRIPSGVIRSVLADLVTVHLLRVTDRAVDLAAAPAHWISRYADVRVALDAGVVPVNGILVFLEIDIERDRFSVDRLLQGFIRVAGETHLVGKTLFVEDASYVMRLMTVDTDRYLMGTLLPQFPPDHLEVDIFDLGVAFHASARYVSSVDG